MRASARVHPGFALLGEGTVDCSPSAYAWISLGVWSPGHEPPTVRGFVADGGVSVLFSGYLREVPHGYAGEADYALARYQADDWSWLDASNGVFAFAVVDGPRRRCFLAVDRLGIRPLYFAADDGGVRFASVLAAAVPWERPRLEPDYDTLQESAVLGFPLSSRTFVQGVQRLPPGTLLELGPGRRESRRYWSLEDTAPGRQTMPSSFLDESRERLHRSLTRLLARVDGSTLCPLSSGHDSRRLLLEARAIGADLTAMTVVWPYAGRHSTTIDPEVTAELCRRSGVPHRLIQPPRARGPLGTSAARRIRDVLLDEQVYGRHHVWALPLVAAIAPSSRGLSLDGLAGDTLFNNPFYSLPRAMWGRSRVDRDLLDAIAPDRQLADRSWNGLLSRSLSARLTDALNALPDGPSRLSFFYLLGRSRGMVALLPYGLLDTRIESVCPYLDHEVMDHALAVDPVVKGDLRLQALALHRHFPEYSDIPSSHSPLSDVPARYLQTMHFADPETSGRLSLSTAVTLVRGAADRQHGPSIERRDLAFACLSALGLARVGGGWRQPRILTLAQAYRTITLLTDPDDRSMVRRRADASAMLERWRGQLR